MNTKNPPSEEALIALKSLENAVAKALDKKRKLGQYAIMWENGKVIKVDYSRQATATEDLENV